MIIQTALFPNWVIRAARESDISPSQQWKHEGCDFRKQVALPGYSEDEAPSLNVTTTRYYLDGGTKLTPLSTDYYV